MSHLNQFFNLETVEGLIRKLLLIFIVTLSFGYGTGVYYVAITSGNSTKTIQENYLGNEEDESAKTMKFKKPEKEIISIIHSRVISFSLIFLAMGILFFLTPYSSRLKSFLIIEPFVSILITFGGIWLMWKGLVWMKYLIIISGLLMHLSFLVMGVLILITLLKPRVKHF